ncbi:MAG: RnfABCDGE type electron transport complex subunit D [Clostridia bacterium]|nr:RnfABCDGE type electron transport complex subunit D [Clostridia bacterium]
MTQLHISSSPHIHTKKTTTSIMLDVIIALLPATIAGFLIFGLKALSVVMMCIAVCVLSEFIFNKIVKKEDTTSDLSAVVTGLLLGLNLPADTPLWQAAVGSIFAIVVVKSIFGGIGCNLVNPAITARVFMLIAFTSLAKPSFPVDSVATATPLVDLSAGKNPDLLELFLGNVGGAIGETSKLALLIGGIYLICRKVISPVMPLSYIGTVFVFTFLVKDFSLTAALYQILSGGLFIGAFFMATDYVTSPATDKGRLIFGIGAGVITVLIRLWGAYPEGVSFAILFMNILNPYVNVWSRRRLFGRDR